MICNIAIDGVNKKLNEKREKVNVDYSVLSIECKGESPSLMPIKVGDETPSKMEHPKIYHEIQKMKENKENEV